MGTTAPTVSGTVISQSQLTFTPAVPTTILYQAGLGTVTTSYVLPTIVPSINRLYAIRHVYVSPWTNTLYAIDAYTRHSCS